jgi:probable HAF family extracellular repeat protein
LFALLAVPVQPAAQEQQTKERRHYTVTDLGTLGGTFGQAFGINNESWVGGWATTVGDATAPAFLWRRGRMTSLGTLGGIVGEATALNEQGEVVGASETSTVDPLGEEFCGGTFFDQNQVVCLPFLWRHGVMTPLPTLGGNNAGASGINNRGQVVGVAENAIHDPTCVPPQVLQFKPVIWENGEVRALPTVSGYPDGAVQSINDRGQAVGVSTDCIFSTAHGLLWEHGRFTDLGSLGGTQTAPAAINNRAQVIGSADLPPGGGHAFFWQDGGITDLGTLPGDVESFGNAINDKGQMLGQSCDANSNCRAFLWEDGAMTDLNSLIPSYSQLQLFDANGINSRGEIVGLAIQTSTGELRAYLATTCDEVHDHSVDCEDGAAPGATSATSHQRGVSVSENVRHLLRQRMGSRYHIPGLLPPSR